MGELKSHVVSFQIHRVIVYTMQESRTSESLESFMKLLSCDVDVGSLMGMGLIDD